MKPEMRHAVLQVAAAFGWHEMSLKDLGLLLWSLFRYYAIRLEVI